MPPPPQLVAIAEQVRAQHVQTARVRDLLSWFDARGRGAHVVARIHAALAETGLTTVPSFATAWLDHEIAFVARPATNPVQANLVRGGSVDDPIMRVGALPAANQALTTVTRDDSITRAVTLMTVHDFSQLPVMQNSRTVHGMISWRSIGVARARGIDVTLVRHAMDEAEIVPATMPLGELASKVVVEDAVLVRASDNTIQGIVTVTDFAGQFTELAEPFLAVGEIEQQIRRLIDGRFTLEELRLARDNADDGRAIETVADLSFGEYVRLLQVPANWEKLDLDLDRVVVVEMLDSVREIRNDVMHFDPSGISADTREELRRAVGFMQRLAPRPAPQPAAGGNATAPATPMPPAAAPGTRQAGNGEALVRS